MRRRTFLGGASLAALAQAPLGVPVHRVFDKRCREATAPFREKIWPEAVDTFARSGIILQGGEAEGEVGRAPSDRPVFHGLVRGAVNFVMTDVIPMRWDNGRGLAGVATVYEGYALCLLSLRRAHGHQIPFLSTNTCVHELLHVLLHDIFEQRPKGFAGERREWRIDWYATRLWLFRDSTGVMEPARRYVQSMDK